jgi:hypothetical protein
MACAWKGVPAARGGGSPQGYVEYPKNGEQDQGPGQERPEEWSAGGGGNVFQRVFHNNSSKCHCKIAKPS